MIFLLDINVLIALCDPAHPHAEAARIFFREEMVREGWATCPLTQNGFLRIFGSRKYPGGPGSPSGARLILAGLVAAPGHQFWKDDLSLLSAVEYPGLPTSGGVTDFYLLALARKHGGRLATFDAGMDASLLPGGAGAYHLVGLRR
jgi:toxin-antitoxin system PIN domain toxin